MIPMVGNILGGNAAQMAPKPGPNWNSLLAGPNNPMLMLGLSLLAGNRPSTTPTNPWASAAQGLQAGQQMQMRREDQEMQRKMYDAQLEQYGLSKEDKEAERQRTEAIKAEVEKYISSNPNLPAEQIAYARLAPDKFFEAINKPAEDKRTTAQREYQDAVASGQFSGTFPDWKLAMARAGSPQTSVNIAGDNAYEKAFGQKEAERYDNILEAGETAQKTIDNLGALSSMMEGIKTGKLAPTTNRLRAMADALGIEVDKEALASGQGIEAISNRLALALRNPQGGEGMPGNMSDADRNFLVDAVPGLSRSPGGNAKIIEYSTRVAKRQIEIAEMADNYAAEHGRLDAGFRKQVREYVKANPLFDGEAIPEEAPSSLPAGVDQETWNAMTPEERALFK